MKGPPTCVSSSRSAPEHGVKPRQPLLALAGLALRLTLRRWQLYLTAVLVAFALQVALALVFHVPHALELGSSIAIPLVVALVYAFVSADAAETPVPESLTWERFLERAWAVIVIDVLLNRLTLAALDYSTSSNPLELIGGLLAFTFVMLTVFADTSATLDDDVTVWTVIPRAVLRSIATSWNSVTFVRALAIFSAELLTVPVQSVLYVAMTHFGVPQALFWSQIPLATFVTPPLAAITAVVYRDATGVLR